MAVETTNQLKPTASRAADPRRRAWRVLLLAFSSFCVLLTLACYGLWQFRSFAVGSPPEPATLTLLSSRGVFIQERGLVYELQAKDGAIIKEGDTILVDSTLAPGVAATLELFDGTVIELWPGTTLHLDTLQRTRYSNYRQTIALSLDKGMARLTMPSRLPYQKVEFTLTARHSDTLPTTVNFKEGGTYSVRLVDKDSPMTDRTLAEHQPATEVAVQQGLASVESGSRQIGIEGAQRVLINDEGVVGPQEASWQLVRDGKFTQYSDREYNCTTLVCTTTEISSTTWTVYARPMAEDSPLTASFRITRIPGTSTSPSDDQPNAANFTRYGSHGKGLQVGITQTLQADITPYREVVFTADLRILDQSLPEAGDKGVECPITIHWVYTNRNGIPGQSFDYCYHAKPSDDFQPAPEPHIKTIALEGLMEWETVKLDLLADIPSLGKIDELWIYANGHDYSVEVANISLTAR